MFDIKAIRDDPAAFDRGLERRGLGPQAAALVALDDRRRGIVTRLQEVQARRNAASKEIGKARGTKDDATAERLMAEVAGLKAAMAEGEAEQARIDKEIDDALAVLPNQPRDDVPDGADEKDNKEVRRVGEPRSLRGVNKPKQHFELGEALGMMDFEAAAKISGARFVFLKGALARLERALGQLMLDVHTGEFGYLEVNPPLLVRDDAAFGTGNLPKFSEDLFKTGRGNIDARALNEMVQTATLATAGEREQFSKKLLAMFSDYESFNRLWLIPTAEVSLTNLVREQILSEEQLPLRYTALTPCFRSEAGAAGRDTRGMIRQHQFVKCELVSITTPEKSLEEHERMTACAEAILQKLGLPYRTMLLCAGDMGFASRKTYDIEVWLPGQDAYREISSCSVCGDFQAQRMDARYRPTGGGKPRHVHTLNGSGLAVGRTLVAVLENYQQADGSIVVPDVLRAYMGGMERIARG